MLDGMLRQYVGRAREGWSDMVQASEGRDGDMVRETVRGGKEERRK